MATHPAHARSRPKGSPMLLVLMALVVVPSVVLADHWGAGPAGIIGGLTGLFSLVVFMGGPLRADLRLAGVLAPLLVIAAVVPRMVGEVSRPGASALVVLITFVAALLPLAGPRFGNAGLGLGMTTMFGYGYAIRGSADDQQLVVAAVAGVLVGLLLRLLFGIADPSKPTREQVAEVLVGDDPASATSTAFGTWLSDGRQRWLADVLEAASHYRLALRAAALPGTLPSTLPGADQGQVDELRGRASELADRLRAKPGRGTEQQHAAAQAQVRQPARGPSTLEDAASALDAVEQAILGHDTTPVPIERDRRRELSYALLHPSGRLRSIQVRHAFRTALGVLIMLLVTAPLESGDPLVSTVLLATFGILQASWRDTFTKARNKIIGLCGGSLAVAVILLVAPSNLLVPIAGVSLCLGLWYIVTRPALGAGFMVVVSVGMNAVTRDLDPVDLLLQYVGLTLVAVVVGVVVGFTVVPSFRPAPLRRRIEAATQATEAALRVSRNDQHPLSEVLALQRVAAQKQEELVPDHEPLDDRQLADLDRLRTGLRDLLTLVEAEQLRRDALDQATLEQVLESLAQQTEAAERALLRTLPAA
ncbi:FUSC family protein [Nocardioides houyundeii]|uniref:FUSC family protein n=1 Tax=Nocardioides houyundeii TaxID=2045452 RepID=UPI000C7852A6|nr:FUSC family protein [Nocardioides houyundeii]